MCVLQIEGQCEVLTEKRRTARKEHQCSACLGDIDPGESYMAHFSVFRREKRNEKMCARCLHDYEIFSQAHDGTLFAPSYFSTFLDDCTDGGDDDESEQWRRMLERIRAGRKRNRTRPASV